MDQLSSFRIPGISHVALADRSLAGNMRGYMGHSTLPAKALEFLPWRGASADLRRPHDLAYDLVSIARALFFDTSLILRNAEILHFP